MSMSPAIATPLMVVGRCFALKTIIKMVQTASVLGTQALGRILAVLPDFVKGRITCGTVNGDMVYLDLLGTINCERYLGGGQISRSLKIKYCMVYIFRLLHIQLLEQEMPPI